MKPNRLASGITFNLFEIQGDLRYIALFALVIAALVIAFLPQRDRRGWLLVALGNLILFLALLLPANAAIKLLANAATIFPEGTHISNPRIFASSAIAFGLLGGYIILFGGVRDLVAEKVSAWQRALASVVGLVLVILALLNGSFDIYSIMVEFSNRGATLGQRFIEHLVFVIVSLAAGLIIGIALGLWAARDKRMESAILYTVGIIQTIPSLALFGVLLVPLARLGDQMFLNVVRFFVISLIVSLIVFFAVTRLQNTLPNSLKPWSIIIAVVLLFVPISLFTIIVITFGFKAVLNVFLHPALSQNLGLLVGGYGLALLALWLDRRLDRGRLNRWLRYSFYALLIVSSLVLAGLIVSGAQEVVAGDTLSKLSIRDLGVSGIGTAPAIIALTLYSLLPLVRNTYTGLRNVDPAVIDSGRGMGMTSAQIFFQIELPLAFPVIMAGVRNAGISLVGIAAVASVIGAGALGDFILLGVNTTSVDLILLGAIPAVILAVLLDAGLQILEGLFTSPGIRRQAL